MDDRKHSISPDALYTLNGSEAAPIIADVRRHAAGADTLIADAFHGSPDAVEQWPHRALDQRRQRYAIRPDRDRTLAISPN
jgi:hypothetical protein